MELLRIKLGEYWSREDGAITVDWVVMTAAVVALAGIAITNIHGPTGNVGDNVGSFLTDGEPGLY